MKTIDVLFIDVDSCLCGIEGIDLLARRAGVSRKVVTLTRDAMDGIRTFEDVFKRRLDMICPKKSDLLWLSEQYKLNITPFAIEVIRTIQERDIDVYLLTGGYSHAILPLAELFGLPKEHILANQLYFAYGGSYMGYDRQNPLTTQQGKRIVIESVKAAHQYTSVGLVGDSATDVITDPPVSLLIGFGGYVQREVMMKNAHAVITECSFRPLLEILFGRDQ